MARTLSLKSPGSLRDGMYKLWRAVLGLEASQETNETDFEAIEDRLDAIETYSETATAIGVWIDELPIYRKVIDIGAMPNATSKNVAHGLTGISEIISIRGVANNDDTGFAGALSIPSEVTGVSVDATNVTVTTASALTAYDQAYVILEYTLVGE